MADSRLEYQLEKSTLGKATRVAANTLAFPSVLLGPTALTSLGVGGTFEHVGWEGITTNLGNLVNSPAVGEAVYQFGAWGFGLGSVAAILASVGVGFSLGMGYVAEGKVDKNVIDFLRGIENRKKNKDIELSDAVRDAHGRVGSSLLQRAVRTRYGNPHFTNQTEEGTLVQTRRGVALLNDEQVTAYGETKSPFCYEHGQAVADGDKVHVFYVADQHGSDGGWATREFRLLSADRSKGTLEDNPVVKISFKYDAPRLTREEIDGKAVLVLNEYFSVGSSGAYAAGFDKFVLNPETREFTKQGIQLVSSDTSGITNPRCKVLLDGLVGAEVPEGYNPNIK